MRQTVCGYLVAAVVLVARVCPADPVTIRFDVDDLGEGRYQYTYALANDSLASPLTEFSIWFPLGSYENLVLATPESLASIWDDFVVQPDPLLGDDGFYDALLLSGEVPWGGEVDGFAVQFDWLGKGTPGAQRFDVVDPTTFETLYSGQSIPEPTSAVLVGVLAIWFLGGRANRGRAGRR